MRVDLDPLAALIWLVVRGFYLWALIPLGVIMGEVVYPLLQRQGASICQLIGWLDANAMAAMFKSVLRPLQSASVVPWIPWSQLGAVTHRVRLFGDPDKHHGPDDKFDMN